MDDIAELERRLTAALARVGQAVDRMAETGSGGDVPTTANTALQEQLDAEREVNSALEARMADMQDTHEGRVRPLNEEIERLQAALASRDAELQSLKAVTEGLRETNAALRDASAKNGTAPVDEAREAEVRALRAERKAERAEMDDLFAALEPILKEEARHA